MRVKAVVLPPQCPTLWSKISTMKNLTWFLLFFLSIAGLRAQTIDEDYAAISAHCCSCMEKKMAADPNVNVQAALGLCMMGGISKDPEMSTRLGIDFSDSKSMEKIGEQVGMRMLVNCPAIMMQLIEESGQLENSASSPVNASLTGKIESIQESPLATALTLTTAGGDQLSVLWLTTFPGDEELIKNWDKLKGKQVKIDYQEELVFSSKLRQYVKRRVIKGATILE